MHPRKPANHACGLTSAPSHTHAACLAGRCTQPQAHIKSHCIGLRLRDTGHAGQRDIDFGSVRFWTSGGFRIRTRAKAEEAHERQENGSHSATRIQTHPKKPANHACRLTSHQEPLHGITAADQGTREQEGLGDSEILILAQRGSGLREGSDSGLGLRRRKLTKDKKTVRVPQLAFRRTQRNQPTTLAD
jgi:hypothetical protein